MSRPKDVQALFEKVLNTPPGPRATPPAAPAPARTRREARLVRPVREAPPEPAAPPERARTVREPDFSLTGAVADVLAEGGGWRTEDVANRLGRSVEEIRDELRSMEAAGIAYRTGLTRATRWFLG